MPTFAPYTERTVLLKYLKI